MYYICLPSEYQTLKSDEMAAILPLVLPAHPAFQITLIDGLAFQNPDSLSLFKNYLFGCEQCAQ